LLLPADGPARIGRVDAAVAAPDGREQVLPERWMLGRDPFDRALEALGDGGARSLDREVRPLAPGSGLVVDIARSERRGLAHQLGHSQLEAGPLQQAGEVVQAAHVAQSDGPTLESDRPEIALAAQQGALRMVRRPGFGEGSRLAGARLDL